MAGRGNSSATVLVSSLTDWVRGGECNGCGWCCQMVTRMEIAVHWHPKIDERYYEVRGFEWKEVDGSKLGFIKGALYAPCPMHDLAGLRCVIHANRPQVCRDFPVTPDQIQDTPCSYFFSRPTLKNSTERIGGDGSSWPGHTVKTDGKI